MKCKECSIIFILCFLFSTEGMTVEAILSLARIMKENSQKLERHEVRERLLGEHMKKVVGALTKKVSILDTFVSNMTKIEGRIFGIEKLISQVSSKT